MLGYEHISRVFGGYFFDDAMLVLSLSSMMRCAGVLSSEMCWCVLSDAIFSCVFRRNLCWCILYEIHHIHKRNDVSHRMCVLSDHYCDMT